MEIKIDTKADALYIRLKRGKVYKTTRRDDLIVDLDRNKDIIGIEVLNYSKRTNAGPDKYSVSFGDVKKRSLLPA
jgi:uncharacterized protein YuzE